MYIKPLNGLNKLTLTNVNAQMLNSVLILCIILMAAGCKADLTGKRVIFLAEYDLAIEKIELLPTGSFTHAVKLKNGQKEAFAEGKWHYSEDKDRIIFDSNYMIVVDGYGKFNSEFESKTDGIVSLPIYSWLGHILMGSDNVVEYKLIDN